MGRKNNAKRKNAKQRNQSNSGADSGPPTPEPEARVTLHAGKAMAAVTDYPVGVTVIEQQEDAKVLELKWGQLSELLGWFDMIAKTDSTASLTFAASMSKEQRAQIHQRTTASFPGLESVSDGIGEERHISVVAKGNAQRRQLTPEQEKQAALLWKLARAAGVDISRDEVALRFAGGNLDAGLKALWDSQAADQERIGQLCAAAAAGDVAAIQAIAASDPELLKRKLLDMEAGTTPLHKAAACNQLGALRALAAAGAELDLLDAQGRTPLQLARKMELCDAEAVLLQLGAIDPDKDDWHIGEKGIPELKRLSSGLGRKGPSSSPGSPSYAAARAAAQQWSGELPGMAGSPSKAAARAAGGSSGSKGAEAPAAGGAVTAPAVAEGEEEEAALAPVLRRSELSSRAQRVTTADEITVPNMEEAAAPALSAVGPGSGSSRQQQEQEAPELCQAAARKEASAAARAGAGTTAAPSSGGQAAQRAGKAAPAVEVEVPQKAAAGGSAKSPGAVGSGALKEMSAMVAAAAEAAAAVGAAAGAVAAVGAAAQEAEDDACAAAEAAGAAEQAVAGDDRPAAEAGKGAGASAKADVSASSPAAAAAAPVKPPQQAAASKAAGADAPKATATAAKGAEAAADQVADAATEGLVEQVMHDLLGAASASFAEQQMKEAAHSGPGGSSSSSSSSSSTSAPAKPGVPASTSEPEIVAEPAEPSSTAAAPSSSSAAGRAAAGSGTGRAAPAGFRPFSAAAAPASGKGSSKVGQMIKEMDVKGLMGSSMSDWAELAQTSEGTTALLLAGGVVVLAAVAGGMYLRSKRRR